MKKLILLFAIINVTLLNAQTAQFAWMAGSTFTNQLGTYGTQGVASTTNAPGSRAFANTWTDNSGNLWLFGGQGHATTPSLGHMNDLWKHTPSSNEWVWVSGANVINQLGVYGTKGIASATNSPGARGGSATWVDNNGNFWMFGGAGYGSSAAGYGNLNDLWKYNPTTQEWVWVTGSNIINQNGAWGTKGVPSTTNTPSSRLNSVCWIDNSGNLWLFGGNGRGVAGFDGLLNDLWKYDISTNEWTWVSGGNGINSIGVYGTQGVGSTANIPGTRYGGVAWIDNAGDFWLFGGQGLGTVMITGSLSDLWKYNISTNQWTWIKGANTTNSTGVYGTKGSPALTNLPGARYFSLSWKDNFNNLWMYGGNGNGASASGSLNDLWQYNISNNMWVWVEGSNAPGQAAVYGTQGVSSMTNTPGGRYNAGGWKDLNGDLWMMTGKINTAYKSDLWKINICNAPVSPTASSSQTICVGSAATLTATGIGTLSWYNSAVGGTFLGIGNSYSTPTLTATTTYYVQDSTCARSIRTAVNITVTQPTITITGPATVCSGSLTTLTATGAASYTWSNGATTSTTVVSPTVATVYTVTGADALGCVSVKTKSISVLALPSISVSGSTMVCKGAATILNATGANSYTWSTGSVSSSIITAGLSNTTVYTVTGTGSNGCRNINTHTVNVYVVPVTISGTYSVCSGQSTIMSASGATSYTWSAPIIGTVYGPTVTVYPSTSYNYSITAKDATNCTLTQTFVITPLMNPAINISIPPQQCPGAAVTLTASGASTYTWLPMNVTGSSAILTPTAMTMFTVVGTAVNTCTTSTVSVVSVKNPPSVSISSSSYSVSTSIICSGSPINLLANGAVSNTYTWSTGATSLSTTENPTITTTYSVTGVGSNGCMGTAVKTITVNPLPDVQVVTTGTLLCAGQSATLSVSGANTYTWNNGSNNTDIVVSPSSTSNYTVTGKDLNNCSKTAVFTQSVSICTGLENLNNDISYLVYPNPTNGLVNVDVESEMNYVLVNVIGEHIAKGEFILGKNYIDLSSMSNGVYFLQLKQGQQTKTIRLVKQ